MPMNLDSIKGKISTAFKPAMAIGDMSMKNLEKLSTMQLDSAKFYTHLNIDQLREAAKSEDLKSLKGFVAGRMSYLNTVKKRITDDFKSVKTLGSESTEELKSILTPSKKEAPKKAKPATKPAAKKAAPKRKPAAKKAEPAPAPVESEKVSSILDTPAE